MILVDFHVKMGFLFGAVLPCYYILDAIFVNKLVDVQTYYKYICICMNTYVEISVKFIHLTKFNPRD